MLICERASELADAPVAVICVKDSGGVNIAAVSPRLSSDRNGPAGRSFHRRRGIDQGVSLRSHGEACTSRSTCPSPCPTDRRWRAIIVGGSATASLIIVRSPGAEMSTPPLESLPKPSARRRPSRSRSRSSTAREQNVLVRRPGAHRRDLHITSSANFRGGPGLQIVPQLDQ